MFLEVLAGRATSLQLQPAGHDGVGIEFLLQREGITEAHQVKRQVGNLSNWTIARLKREGVLTAGALRVSCGEEFHFVSTVPARLLDELSDRARRSDDYRSFLNADLQGGDLSDAFQQLLAVWGEPEMAWSILRRFFVHWPDERELRAHNAALAGALLTGATGEASAAALGDLIESRLGQTLESADVADGLEKFGLSPKTDDAASTAISDVGRMTERWFASVEPEMLKPALSRSEAAAILSALGTNATAVFAVGDAGGGKTGVLHEVAKATQARGVQILALRLDRGAPAQTAAQLGTAFGLSDSPVAVLGAAAAGQECLLVIDQLDAVSYGSGRIATDSFDAVADMLRQAEAFPTMGVVLAVRRFDVDNDPRLRGLVADSSSRTVEVGPLDNAQVDDALESLGLSPAEFAREQRELLRLPLNLVLLSAVVGGTPTPQFQTTRDLMDLFWDRRRRDANVMAGRQVRFEAVIRCVCQAMSSQQRLAVPSSVLDDQDLQSDADVLTSLHVLVSDSRQIAFFHESFFDYAFARQWLTRGESLVGFLLDRTQDLFRRAQVRQVLLHLRDDDEPRFRREVADLLGDERIRFHIKDVVIAILRALPHPSRDDWLVVERLLAGGGPLSARLWQAMRTEAWFVCLDEAGVLQNWLASSNPEHVGRALEITAAGATGEPDRLARLLAPRADQAEFPDWFRWLATWMPFDQHRPLFEMLLESVRRGEWRDNASHLGMVSSHVGEHEPAWAAELLAAWLTQPGALTPVDSRLAALDATEHSLQELVNRGAADGRAFVEQLLGYLLSVMSATEYGVGEHRPIRDAHFTYRAWHGDHFRMEDAVLSAMGRSLAAFARNDPETALPYLETLAADAHDGSQWLLYQGLQGAPERFSTWVVELLAEGQARLSCGYVNDSFWGTRELIEAVARYWTDDEVARVEPLLLGLAPEWEGLPGGYASFALLSAVPAERLSAVGRRRLGELQRQFESEAPSEPVHVVGGWVGPPVPASAVPHMSDEDWLRVAAKYSDDRTDFTTLRGGAWQQGNVLADETQQHPLRFARLGLRLGPNHHPAYLAGILRGLGQTTEPVDTNNVFALVRHAAALHNRELDRWIGWALRPTLMADIPADVITIVLQRALTASDPDDDMWLVEAGSGPYYGGDPFHAGMNSDRGQLSLSLRDLLVHDTDGSRTALVAPSLTQLAADKTVAVRTCVGGLIHAAFRYAQENASDAFDVLVDADDRLLASDPVERLTAFVGLREPNRARSVVDRMLASAWEEVREAGGRVAAFLALEAGGWNLEALSQDPDPHIRTGVALVCAQRLPFSSEVDPVARVLVSFFDDTAPGVRGAAVHVAAALRDRPLADHHMILKQLIGSESFSAALPQLLITLEHADSAIADVALDLIRRFADESANDVSNIQTRAAGDARNVAELAVRIYAEDAQHRSEALDLLDRLLAAGAWGVEDVVGGAER